MSSNHYDAIIIGGGASGLMCAQTAGHLGKKVLVLDSSNKVGKKILMSGGGRCNFTNLYVDADNFISNNPHFCKSALSRYTQWDFIALVEKHDVAYHERQHGELFCNNSAKEILGLLLDECAQSNVQIKTKCHIEFIETARFGEHNSYTLRTNVGVFSAPSLVIATGGLSIPTMGASGYGYDIAQKFSLPLLPRRAGLTAFTFSDKTKAITERLSGLALDVIMRVGQTSFRENMLFTHRGISGPVALQISNYWQEGECIYINLLPDTAHFSSVFDMLLDFKKNQTKSLLRNLLGSKFTKNLCLELQNLVWPELSETPIAEFTDSKLRAIAQFLENWELKPSGTEGYRTAEVTLGGLDTDALSSKTMECKTQKGLFFIGEVVDVTGHLGGFNFQWAWASGVAAGESV